MTFNEIEKEFDEYYDIYNADKGGLIYPNQTKAQIKSFLKQSFIKYLHGQAEWVSKKVDEEVNHGAEEMADVHIGKLNAYRDVTEFLQAQIKELEG